MSSPPVLVPESRCLDSSIRIVLQSHYHSCCCCLCHCRSYSGARLHCFGIDTQETCCHGQAWLHRFAFCVWTQDAIGRSLVSIGECDCLLCLGWGGGGWKAHWKVTNAQRSNTHLLFLISNYVFVFVPAVSLHTPELTVEIHLLLSRYVIDRKSVV